MAGLPWVAQTSPATLNTGRIPYASARIIINFCILQSFSQESDNMEMPKYLFSKRFLTITVLVIFLFSIPFLLIYKPFSTTVWIGFSSPRHLVYTIVFFALAISLLACSKIALYRFQASHVLTAGIFALWAFAEFFLIAVIYITITPAATGDTLHISLPLILRSSLCVGLIITLPYGYLCLYASYKALQEEYNALKASTEASKKAGSVTLCDYKGIPVLTLETDAIYYMEAQDNYVSIHYVLQDTAYKYMLRCPTQNIEAMLEGTSLVRCHRSYIANLSHVAEFIRGHKRATIVLDNPERKEISVSKSYYKQTLARMQELNPASQSLIKRI